MPKSVILLSGGLDSAANLAIAVEQSEPVLALTMNYGQRAALREIESAQKFCEYYEVPHEVLDLPWLGELSHSALNQMDVSIPHVKTNELDVLKTTLASAQKVWVPNRNGLFIEIAASFAESLGATEVIVGFNAEEAVTFPDNSEAFVRSMNDSLCYSTANRVQVVSYTQSWVKTQIVQKLVDLGNFPFDWIWSCYYGGDTACQVCESCVRFQRAIQSAQVGVFRESEKGGLDPQL
ncbi:MAG: 7-cyano-7-deazaguanine synthase QueC [Bdellovibrionaceae bacterium]|nr:7-cyano-7-deazaguanine synthase QueC [Pseudobdellovibrionaceae bacterium]